MSGFFAWPSKATPPENTTMPFMWKPDEAVPACELCDSSFNVFRRRHHCRICGKIFCDSCCHFRVSLPSFGYSTPVRICVACYQVANGTFETKRQEDFAKIVSFSNTLVRDHESKEWLLLLGRDATKDEWTRRIFGGVPDHLRKLIWPYLADSNSLLHKNEGVFQKLVETSSSSSFLHQIQEDTQRTFSDHERFTDSQRNRQESMQRVLLAFSMYSTEIPYQQGMTFLAGICLLYLNEENSFWLLVQIMSKYKVCEFYSNATNTKYLQRFTKTLSQILPNLYHHFVEKHISYEIIVSQWFRTLFAYCFPTDVVCRIWDVFLIEGFDFLLWSALAFFEDNLDFLIKANEMEALNFLRNLPPQSYTRFQKRLSDQI